MKCKTCENYFETNYKGQEYCEICLDKRIKGQCLKSSRDRMLRNREFVRNYKNDKKCEICGYNKYSEILVFHHKNKKNKIDGINYLMKSLKHPDRIKTEIEKCILICPNCHHELHLLERNKK